MNITFQFELNTSNSSSKEGRVLIRCTQDRRHKRIGTGVALSPKYWDKVHHKIKSTHPLCHELNNLIIEKLKKVTAAYTNLLSENADVTLEDIVLKMTSVPMTNFFDFALRTKMAEIKSTNKLGTYRRYEAVLNKFKDFTGNNLNINRVNYELLKKYEVHLINNLKNSRNTVSSNFSVLRAIINEAIRHDVYKSRNPFSQLQLKYEDKSKEKLTAAELNLLMNNPIPKIQSVQLDRAFIR